MGRFVEGLDRGQSTQAWGDGASATNAGGEKASIEPMQAELRALSPDTNAQRLLQSRALQVSGDIAEAHWLLTETVGDGLPWAFLAFSSSGWAALRDLRSF